jgi:transcriptional regulator with XRE-family HTH domain
MTEPRDAEAVDEKTARVAEVLSAAVRIAGRSRLSMEHQMGLSSGYLSKILGGTVELRLRHVSMILDALEVDPADFFRVAFPRRQSSSRAGRRLMEDVESLLARERAPEALADDEFDEQVKRSLVRLLGLGPGSE